MKIPQNVKIVVNSVFPLLAVLILFAFAGRFGVDKISEMRARVQKSQSNVDAFTSKLSVLESVDESLSRTNFVLSALPSRNSSIVVVSQLKILAGEQGIFLTNIKGGSEIKDPNGFSRVDITFDALGVRPQIMAFAESISTIAPLTLLDKIKINESGGGVRANIQVKSYWSELPKSLPSTTDQLSTLTNDEKNLIVEIAKLNQPLFIELPASVGSGKSEPFN